MTCWLTRKNRYEKNAVLSVLFRRRTSSHSYERLLDAEPRASAYNSQLSNHSKNIIFLVSFNNENDYDYHKFYGLVLLTNFKFLPDYFSLSAAYNTFTPIATDFVFIVFSDGFS